MVGGTGVAVGGTGVAVGGRGEGVDVEVGSGVNVAAEVAPPTIVAGGGRWRRLRLTRVGLGNLGLQAGNLGLHGDCRRSGLDCLLDIGFLGSGLIRLVYRRGGNRGKQALTPNASSKSALMTTKNLGFIFFTPELLLIAKQLQTGLISPVLIN